MILITEVIRKALRQSNLESDGSGLVTKQDCLDFINEARRRFQEFIDIVKGDSRIVAVADQHEYLLPLDFKTNLYRVEYNGKALVPVAMDFLDEYDSGWRLTTTQNPPDDTPKYYVRNAPERFLYIYPPPSETGDYVELSGNDTGAIESITLGGDTVTLGASDTGAIEKLNIAGETFLLRSHDTGLIEKLVPQASNIRVLYDKFFTDIAISNFSDSNDVLDTELEPFQDAILDYVVWKISRLPQTNMAIEEDRINRFEATVSKLIEDKAKNTAPMRISVKRAKNLSWGRRRYV
jgi:hypothetical protein